MTGILMSISTTSGLSARAWRTAWTPSLASPTTVSPGAESTRTMNPARTSASSSATSTRMSRTGRLAVVVRRLTATPSPSRQPGDDGEAAARGRPGGQGAAEQFGSLPHAGDAEAFAGSGSNRVRTAVVGHRDGELVGAVADLDLGPCPGGVLGHVGQRLLRDPVRGQFHRGAVGLRLSGAVVADVKAGPAQPADKRGQVAERRRRRLVGVLGVADLPEQRPQLVKRGPAGGLDRRQRGPGLVGLLGEDQSGHPGLHRDRAQAVRHHVVHLPGQPQPFLRPGQLELVDRPAALNQLQLLAVLADGSGHVARQPARNHRDQLDRVLIVVWVQMHRDRERPPGGGAGHDGRRQRPRPAAQAGRGERRDRQIRSGVADERGERHVGQGGGHVDGGDHEQHRDRPPAPDDQRRGGQGAEGGFRAMRVGGSSAEQDRHGEGGEAARRQRAVHEIGADPVREPVQPAAARGGRAAAAWAWRPGP